MGLDSIYAMTAVPARSALEKKRIVEQVKKGDAIHSDSHETPQSQLPPKTEARKPRKGERRKSEEEAEKPRVDRRMSKGRRQGEDENEDLQEQTLTNEDSPFEHIDITA